MSIREKLESIEWDLRNQFQNEQNDWYAKAAWEVYQEQLKDGDSTANIINRLYR